MFAALALPEQNTVLYNNPVKHLSNPAQQRAGRGVFSEISQLQALFCLLLVLLLLLWCSCRDLSSTADGKISQVLQCKFSINWLLWSALAEGLPRLHSQLKFLWGVFILLSKSIPCHGTVRCRKRVEEDRCRRGWAHVQRGPAAREQVAQVSDGITAHDIME